jgi:uncharacterized OB-fold protein
MTEQSTVVTAPIPEPDELTAFFWASVEAGYLSILRCQDCGNYVHYPRPICNRCQSMNLGPEQVSGRGSVYSYTWAVQPFHPYFVDKVPYCLAVIELEEQAGLRITSNIVDTPAEQIRCGLAVEVVFRQADGGVTLPLFVAAARDRSAI